MRELEKVTFMSESSLYHLFSAQLGTMPLKYRNRLRIEKAAELLFETDCSIEEIASAAGFGSYGYFRQIFKGYTGMTPYDYRRQEKRR